MTDPLAPIPFHIARAYGVSRVPAARPVSSATSIQRDQPQAFANPNLARLVAGTVSGSIDFSADQPQPSREALSIYRHPADRNAAATGVQAGRLVDIDG